MDNFYYILIGTFLFGLIMTLLGKSQLSSRHKGLGFLDLILNRSTSGIGQLFTGILMMISAIVLFILKIKQII